MPLLPPVFVELKANASEFMSTMDSANSKVEKLGKQGASTGAQFRAHLGAGLTAGGAAATAAGAVLLTLGEKMERSHKDLEVAIKNTGASYEEYGRQVDQAVTRQEKFGHSSSDTQSALAVLTRATGSAKTALSDMALVTQLAAVRHTSLAEAAAIVAKMHAGAYRPLKEFGISLKDANAGAKELTAAEKENTTSGDALAKAKQHLADLLDLQHAKTKLSVGDQIALRNAQQAVTDASAKHESAVARLTAAHEGNTKAVDFNTASHMVLAKIQGTAEAQAGTFGGRVEALKTRMEDMAATVGQKVGPALTVAGPLMMGVGAAIQSGVIPMVAKAVVSFGSMAVAALVSFGSMIVEAAVWAASMVVSAAIALLPFLPLIAIVAVLGVAAYELYQHWDEVWGFIKSITSDAVAVILTTVDTVVDFFTKLPGRIIAVITRFGGDLVEWIKGAFVALMGALEPAINLYLDVYIRLPLRIITALARLGGDLVEWIKGAWKAFQDADSTAVTDVVDFFTKIPGRVVAAVGDGAKLLLQWGKDIISGIVRGIKSAGSAIGDALGGVVSSIPGASLLKDVPGLGGLFKAGGGPVSGGMPYIVGERGPELFVPGMSGGIIPNHQLGVRESPAGPRSTSVEIHLHVAGDVVGTDGIDDRVRVGLLDAVAAALPRLRAAGVAA